jgi:hypothetical protein
MVNLGRASTALLSSTSESNLSISLITQCIRTTSDYLRLFYVYKEHNFEPKRFIILQIIRLSYFTRFVPPNRDIYLRHSRVFEGQRRINH